MSNEKYLQEYLCFKDELKTFLFRLLTNRQDCEDILQETYIRFSQNLDAFRGDSSFKTWVYAIATNLAKSLLEKQSRWQVDYQDRGRDLHLQNEEIAQKMHKVFFSAPDATLEIAQHLDYCFTCISKTLSLTQQICLLLKDVYGFKQDEIGLITGLSDGKVKHGIADARKTMIRIFNNRCALISKSGVCHQCTGLKGFLTPEQDAHQEANRLKLVKEAKNADNERLLELRLDIVRSTDPFNSAKHELHIYFLENLPRWVEMMKNPD